MAIGFNNAQTTIDESARLHMDKPKHKELLLAVALVGSMFGGIKQAQADDLGQIAQEIGQLAGAGAAVINDVHMVTNPVNNAGSNNYGTYGYSTNMGYVQPQGGYQQGYVQGGYQQMIPQGVGGGGYPVQLSPSQIQDPINIARNNCQMAPGMNQTICNLMIHR